MASSALGKIDSQQVCRQNDFKHCVIDAAAQKGKPFAPRAWPARGFPTRNTRRRSKAPIWQKDETPNLSQQMILLYIY